MKNLFALVCLLSISAFAEGSVWETAPDFSNLESETLESSASEESADEASAPEAPAVEPSTVAAPVAEETLPAAKRSAPRIANPKEHRGFYSNFSTGYSYVNFHAENVDGADYEEVSFAGSSFPLMDFRFGVAVGNLVAFYSEFNFAFYLGEGDDVEIYCYSSECDVEKGSDDNAFLARTYVGFGMAVYPFRDTSSVLNGFFLGGSIGYGADAVYGADLESVDSGVNVDWGYTVELGKDWWVNDHLSIGLSAAYFHATPKVNVTGSDNGVDGFHILFRLTRG
ncbi:MAG: DUF1207 domain-containing protein [Fibrobacter sp.]|nr:DUF1207 domain-containing protein [Fibrobacter sp.]